MGFGKASTGFVVGHNNLLKTISQSDCNIFAVLGRDTGKGNNLDHLVSPPVAAAPDPCAVQKEQLWCFIATTPEKHTLGFIFTY